ncbi:metal ABC transporter solute-binding protein, Zn/Mn family [Marinilactibacillus kalidii]|uniref:metal ABC transporter solute-binding protein, Zn/Mn family n=1 Tax=Marinilactibacillus kalidii TaxID=2820274 RepID=UPI001ABE37FD|nr:zinc ABC transporter substrate-binding protein [Marinilactibacillus kalidii]
MKRKWIGFTILMSILMLAACSNETATTPEGDEPINVVATTTMIADLVENIGGEYVAVTGLMGPGIDPHTYQPSASDVYTMDEADMIVYNGLHLESQFIEMFEQFESRGVPTTVIADGMPSSAYKTVGGEGSTEYDPHIWFSVNNWINASEYVAEQLAEYDPEHADDYEANAQAYIEELSALADYIETRIEEVPESSRYLVTAHDAFQYFGEEFNFEVVGLQGVNTQTEAGTGDISGLADFIANQKISAVFVESSVSSRNIEALIEAVNSRGQELSNAGELYSDALGDEAHDTETYIKMYRSNIDTIVDALNGSQDNKH